MADWIGWLATAVFMASYFAKAPAVLRRIQGAAACLWALYGVVIQALPIVVANILVAGVAIGSSFARRST
jgi:hypothetical protein